MRPPRARPPRLPSAHAALGLALGLTATCAVVASSTACNPPPAVPTTEARASSINVIAAPPPERVQAGEARRGVGWYPAVAVDDDDRVHVAYTDADVGDVYYAVSASGALIPQNAEPVETHGAAGGFVRMALAPGGAPVISYYHQDEHTLRVAHRPKDVAAMKKAGADVDSTPSPKDATKALAPGWVGEDIAFGDEAGAGSALVVDKHGRPHLLYGVKGDRVRYARRPSSSPAFGGAGDGTWEKLDIDRQSGQSPLLKNDLAVLDDGTAVASYCDWQVAMAHLKLAVRAPEVVGAPPPLFTVQPAREQPKPGIDGPSNALLAKADGTFDVAAVRLDDGSVQMGAFDPKKPAPLLDRHRIASARGPAVIKRGADGTIFVLTRDPYDKQTPGLFLVEIPRGDVAQSKRVLLEKSTQDDAWIDLAIKKNGAPVAVWFSEDAKGLKLYSP